jgi:hypothetical protein
VERYEIESKHYTNVSGASPHIWRSSNRQHNQGMDWGGGGIHSYKIASLSKAGRRKLVGPVSSQATAEHYLTSEIRTHLPTIPNSRWHENIVNSSFPLVQFHIHFIIRMTSRVSVWQIIMFINTQSEGTITNNNS